MSDPEGRPDEPPALDPSGRWAQSAVVLIFLGVIFLPWLDLRPVSARSPRRFELRPPAPAPELEWSTLARYPEAWTRYHDDTFGFRDWFLRGHSAVKVFGFDVSPSPSLLVGKEGWVYWAGERTFEDYRGLVPFGERRLAEWRKALESRRDLLRERGIHYLFVLVPNKSMIYPEYLPDHLRAVGPRRIDQLVERMRESSDVDLLDLRGALLAAKRDEELDVPLYTKLGTHWNGLGAVVANEAILAHLARTFPELEPVPRERLVRSVPRGRGNSLEMRMYLGSLVHQRCVEYELPAGSVDELENTGLGQGTVHRFRGGRPGGLKVLLLHDSFGPQLYSILPWSVDVLECRWTKELPLELLDELDPDVVIQQRVQRGLMTDNPVGWLRQDRRLALERATRIYAIELPGELAKLEPHGDLRLVESVHEGVAGVDLVVQGKGDFVALPAFLVSREHPRVEIRVDYWSSQRATLRIVPAAEGEASELDRGRPVPGDLSSGSGTLLAQLAPPVGTCRLLLRPFSKNARIQIRSITLTRPTPEE